MTSLGQSHDLPQTLNHPRTGEKMDGIQALYYGLVAVALVTIGGVVGFGLAERFCAV